MLLLSQSPYLSTFTECLIYRLQQFLSDKILLSRCYLHFVEDGKAHGCHVGETLQEQKPELLTCAFNLLLL